MGSEVYVARLTDGADAKAQAAAFTRALSATGFIGRLGKRDLVAIKLHVGEKNNVTHLKPELAAVAVNRIRKAKAEPFLTDTSTLYRGQRENAVRHALHAAAHGFTIEATGAPFLPLDGLVGVHEREVEVKGETHDRVKVAGEVFYADALLVLTHATGHIAAGIGAAIKNVGMGLSSRAGKMRQHSSIEPVVEQGKCTNCGKCRRWCPADAIAEREGESFIVRKKCIGCGECIAVCRFGAIKFNYAKGSEFLQRSMAEHAAAVIRHFGAKAAYVTVLADMTRDCDCFDVNQKKFVPDVGMAASNDIVALDQATLDLTTQASGQTIAALAYPRVVPDIQIAHAEKLGLGSRKYELVEV
jgi:hypothetical protein